MLQMLEEVYTLVAWWGVPTVTAINEIASKHGLDGKKAEDLFDNFENFFCNLLVSI